MLESFISTNITLNNYMLLVQKGDELLNAQEALDKFNGATVIAEEGGTHGFDGIENHFDKIRNFLKGE